MANRHKKCKNVGGAAVASGNMDVVKEARKRKQGGEVGAVAGRAQGGRLDRKAGGKVGKSPFSSAGGGKADKSPFFQ